MFSSSKIYDYNSGFSAAFRQWRAQSHCRFLHGYSLRIELHFLAHELDERNWVVDFGSLRSLKGMLEDTLDHKTLVAKDDPHIEWFRQGHELGTLDMVEVDATGCEALAHLIYEVAEQWLKDAGYSPRVFMDRVAVSEHSGNWAGYDKQMRLLQEVVGPSGGNMFAGVDPKFGVPVSDNVRKTLSDWADAVNKNRDIHEA